MLPIDNTFVDAKYTKIMKTHINGNFIFVFILIIIGALNFSCQKEDLEEGPVVVKSYFSTEVPPGSNSESHYYRLFLQTVRDNEDGKCYLAYICDGPFENPQDPACSSPGQQSIIYKENGERIEVQCESTLYPFEEIVDGLIWEIEFTKEHISEIWDVLQACYDMGALESSPEELWERAPYR